MRHILIALAALTSSSFSAVAADAFVPAVTFSAGHATRPGHAIDILSIVPGMDAEEVKAILVAPARNDQGTADLVQGRIAWCEGEDGGFPEHPDRQQRR